MQGIHLQIRCAHIIRYLSVNAIFLSLIVCSPLLRARSAVGLRLCCYSLRIHHFRGWEMVKRWHSLPRGMTEGRGEIRASIQWTCGGFWILEGPGLATKAAALSTLGWASPSLFTTLAVLKCSPLWLWISTLMKGVDFETEVPRLNASMVYSMISVNIYASQPKCFDFSNLF